MISLVQSASPMSRQMLIAEPLRREALRITLKLSIVRVVLIAISILNSGSNRAQTRIALV